MPFLRSNHFTVPSTVSPVSPLTVSDVFLAVSEVTASTVSEVLIMASVLYGRVERKHQDSRYWKVGTREEERQERKRARDIYKRQKDKSKDGDKNRDKNRDTEKCEHDGRQTLLLVF